MTRPNPYVGPRSFLRDDQNKFYGRPREVERLLNLLIAERIVLLHSPSGAGKTSLINAGLIPELEEENFSVLPVMRVNRFLPADRLDPGIVNNRYVFSALLFLEGYEEDKTKPQKISPDRLKELAGMPFADYLSAYVKKLPPREESGSEDRQIVLIFDQFEEILVSNPADFPAKLEFFQQVGAALRDDNRWALFSMREDYVASLGSLLRPMPTRLNTRFKLELLTRKWARDAIEKPALKDITYSKEAVDKLIDDLATVKAPNYDGTGTTTDVVGEYVEPMQLQVVCYRLWESLTFPEDPAQKVEVKHTDLKSTHVDSSLAAFYEDCLDKVTLETGQDEGEIRQWIQDNLITSAGTRGLVFMGEDQAEGMSKTVVDKLEELHLLRGEQRGGSRWIELTHDRFIKPIVQSNLPWVSLRRLRNKTRRASALALFGFVLIMLFGVFFEWWMTKPFRESQRYWMELTPIHKLQEPVNAMKPRINAAIQASETANEGQLWFSVFEAKRDLANALSKPEAHRHGKGKLLKKAKLQERNVKHFEAASNTAFKDSSPLGSALEHLRKDSESDWKSFSLSDDDVAALLRPLNETAASMAYMELSRSRELALPSGSVSGQTIAILKPNTGTDSISYYNQRRVEEFIKKVGDTKKNKDFNAIVKDVRRKVVDAGTKLFQAKQQKSWNNLKFEENLRVVQEAAQIDLKVFMRPLATYQEKSNRRSDWLNAQEKQVTSWHWTHPMLTRLYTLRPTQAANLFYGIWCALFIIYFVYLGNSMRAAEQVLSGLDLTHTKIYVADPLGWRLTKSIPPVITVVAICCLLLLHVRATLLVSEVLRDPENAYRSVWPFMLGLPVGAIGYYISQRLMVSQFEPAKSQASIVLPKPVST